MEDSDGSLKGPRGGRKVKRGREDKGEKEKEAAEEMELEDFGSDPETSASLPRKKKRVRKYLFCFYSPLHNSFHLHLSIYLSIYLSDLLVLLL